MKPGSVVVDLAAETGGNVEGSVAGEVVAHRQRPGLGDGRRAVADAGRASRLYAQNVVNLVTLMTTRRGRRRARRSTSTTRSSHGACVVHDGVDPARARPDRARSAGATPTRRDQLMDGVTLC